MPSEKINQQLVGLAYCPPGKRKVDYFDTQITGFILETRPSGGSTFAFRYKDKYNRQRQMKIGNAADITADQARKKAKDLKARTTLGENPAEDKKVARIIPTIAQLADRYLDYVKTYKKSWDIDERYLRIHIIPQFGKLRLDELKQEDVTTWLDRKVKEEGYALGTRNRFQVVLSYMYKLADRWGLPGAEVNPLKGLRLPNPNNNRERFLTPEETRRLLAACEKNKNRNLKAMVQIYLLTGVRRRELMDAKWQDVDLEQKRWKIPTPKTGTARYVPLPDAAVAVFEGLRRYSGCPYVVPNPKTKQPYHSIHHAWDKARIAAGLPEVRLHDLRHSAASNMVNSGQSLYVVGKVLGHAQPITTQRYAHLSQDTLLEAVNKASQFVT